MRRYLLIDLLICTVATVALTLGVMSVPGCTAAQVRDFETKHNGATTFADQAAAAAYAAAHDPLVQTGAGSVPYGGTILGALGLVAGYWIRHRQSRQTVSTTTTNSSTGTPAS